MSSAITPGPKASICAWCECSVVVHSDIRLLEQMLRNLLSNAVKYTRHGKVLLGCRHHAEC